MTRTHALAIGVVALLLSQQALADNKKLIPRNAPSAVKLTTCEGAAPSEKVVSSSALALISDSYQGRFMRMTWPQASKEMSTTLASGWGVKQTIANQPPQVRDVMTLVAGLAFNGYAVAAQMVNNEIQLREDIRKSPLSKPLRLMVDTTTEPTGHDDDLFKIDVALKASAIRLDSIYAKSPYVSSALRGAAYGDGIAEEASVRGICAITDFSAEDRKRIAAEVATVRLRMPETKASAKTAPGKK